MAKDQRKKSQFNLTSRETANGIWAVLSVVIAIFLLLGAFGYAGPAGVFIYEWLSYLFGVGYYLLPVVFLLLALSLIEKREGNFAISQIFGSILLFISSSVFVSEG